MRIISGKHRGRIIKVPNYFKDRPTTDFAKESLFNILNNNYYFEELKVLDLFAGTGNISYEFASRGTPEITSVDLSKKHTNFIENQSEKIFSDTPIMTITVDVFEFLKKHPLDYDLIFADPPYKLEGIEKLPDLVFDNKYLKKDVLFILEHSKYYKFKEHHKFKEERKYGKVHFSFFEDK